MDWAWLGVSLLGVFAIGFAMVAVFLFACLVADLFNEWRNK